MPTFVRRLTIRPPRRFLPRTSIPYGIGAATLPAPLTAVGVGGAEPLVGSGAVTLAAVRVPSSEVVFSGTSSTDNNTSPFTLSHTVEAEYNRRLLVPVGIRGAVTVLDVTYNGVGLTKIDHVQPGVDVRLEVWELEQPDIGTHDVIVTTNSDQSVIVGALTYSGTRSLGEYATSSGSGTSASVTVPSNVNQLVVDFYADQSAGGEPSPAAGQTARLNYDGAHADLASSEEAGAESVTTTWNLSLADFWAMLAVGLIAERNEGVVQPAATGAVTLEPLTATGTGSVVSAAIGSGAVSLALLTAVGFGTMGEIVEVFRHRGSLKDGLAEVGRLEIAAVGRTELADVDRLP